MNKLFKKENLKLLYKGAVPPQSLFRSHRYMVWASLSLP